MVEFFGTYHDFADPGTVTITFERTTDGTIREITAFNMPDGAWIYQLTFDVAWIGRWDVSVVVDQTSAQDTCTNRVTILRKSPLPNTSTATAGPDPGDRVAVIVTILGLLGGVMAIRRLARAVTTD